MVIATQESERTLLPTLAALVPGAVAGWVREVIVADAGSHDATGEVADAAGCRSLILPGPRAARLKAASAMARAPWLLFLEPGTIPDVTWIDETRRFVEQAELTRARRQPRRGVPSPLRNFARQADRCARPMLCRALEPRSGPGLLIATQLYERIGGHRQDAVDPERDLARRLGRGRISVLRSGAPRWSTNRDHTELGKPGWARPGIEAAARDPRHSSGPTTRQINAHTVAPFALARRRCSSSRGMISTKLQGR